MNSQQLDALKAAASEVSGGKYGPALKHDEDGTFITCSRKEKRRDNSMNKPPRVVGMNKQPFTEEIGNGSVCNIITNPFTYDAAGKKGVTMILEAIQVVEWSEYKGGEDFDDAPATDTTLSDKSNDLPF